MKRWLFERFLPMWAKETLLKDYRLLRRENVRLRRLLEQKEAYIKGMHKCIRPYGARRNARFTMTEE